MFLKFRVSFYKSRMSVKIYLPEIKAGCHTDATGHWLSISGLCTVSLKIFDQLPKWSSGHWNGTPTSKGGSRKIKTSETFCKSPSNIPLRAPHLSGETRYNSHSKRDKRENIAISGKWVILAVNYWKSKNYPHSEYHEKIYEVVFEDVECHFPQFKGYLIWNIWLLCTLQREIIHHYFFEHLSFLWEIFEILSFLCWELVSLNLL